MRLRAFFLLILSVITFAAAEVQFDLSSYEPIEYRIAGAEFIPFISSFLSDTAKQSTVNIILPISVHRRRSIREQYFDLNSPINSSEKTTSLFDNSTHTGLFSFQHFNISPDDQNSFIFGINPSISYAHKRYLRPKKFFLSSQTRGQFYNLFLVRRSIDPNYHHENQFALFLELALGGGLIKDVTYPAVCVHVFNYLSEQRLLQDYSHSTIHEISQTFETLQRKRFFDSRKKRIRDIKIITHELYRDKISLQLNPEQLMNVLDYWEYGFNQLRRHGRELVFKVKIFADESYFSDNPYLEPAQDSTGSSVFLRFQTHRSPNLKVYRSILAEIGSKTTDYYEKAYIRFQPQLYIYPNFRSSINITNLFEYSAYLEYPDRHEIFNRLSSSYQYYFSPQMSIIGEWVLNVNTEWDKCLRNSISAGLIFHIR